MTAMRALTAGIVIGLAIATPSIADKFIPFENRSTVAVPTGSPLRFKSFDNEQYDAKFVGTVVLSGTYNIRYEPPGDGDAGYFAAWFNPDTAFLKLLPYWREYRRTRPTELEFDNSDVFVRAILSPDKQNALKRGKLKRVTGRATIKVDRYHMNVTCDHPIYMARFLSLENPAQQIARLEDTTTEGC
jgi:hypothetical protein